MSDTIGKCSDCGGTVVFIDDGACAGWRLCLGCVKRGPHVVLVSELAAGPEVFFDLVEDEEEPTLATTIHDDPTVVGSAPHEIMLQARGER